MALSMDEQRMLAEIERRLAAEDPGLAARLSSFRRPGPAARLRSTRARVMGTLLAVALMAVVSLMIYAMVPFRAHTAKSTLTPQASSRPGTSVPAKAGPPAGAAKAGAPAGTAAAAGSATSRTAASPKSGTGATARAGTRSAGTGTAGTAGGTARTAHAASTAGASSGGLGFTGP
jgi:hypothetical protein